VLFERWGYFCAASTVFATARPNPRQRHLTCVSAVAPLQHTHTHTTDIDLTRLTTPHTLQDSLGLIKEE
jgi:hypothetical protein